MVFYRKYRPQKLSELVGQVTVKQMLQSALAQNKLSHAYLFCGPRGTGKTTTARILAKIINCESQSNIEIPCNQCAACLSVTDGSNLDVIEMDAASNRGIEDIRSLRDNIKLAPVSSKKKVYIIDEVHMLSGDAFNALLKTLEEPPAHVLFILATTEVQKIPQTILSRVTRLDFKAATSEELVEALKRVADNEQIKISEGALLLLARRAQGSFRDGIKLLDLLSSLESVDEKAVEEILRSGVFEEVCQLLEQIAGGKAKEALQILNNQVLAVNIKELTLSILDVLRNLLLIKYDLGKTLVSLEVGGEKYQVLENLAAKFEIPQLINILDHFQESVEQSKFISIPTLPLELAVVESCEMGKKLDDRRSKMEGSPPAGGLKMEDGKIDSLLSTVKSLPEIPITVVASEDASLDMQKIAEKWNYILETVKSNNFSLEALLRSAKIGEVKDKTVVIEVPYPFHQRIIEAPKSRDFLESIFSDILGRAIKVSTSVVQRKRQTEELSNVEVAADDEIVKLAAEIFTSEPVS